MDQIELSQDSLTNALTGVGTERDRREYSAVRSPTMQPDEARRLWEGSRTAGVIVDRPAEDMIRNWIDFKFDDPKTESLFHTKIKELDTKPQFLGATRACRMTGGSLLVMVTEDAIDRPDQLALSMPAKPILHCLTKFDRSECSSWALEMNPTSRNYGKPVTFMVSPATGAPSFRVHYSRCLIFAQPSSGPSQTMSNSCFGPSVFEGCKQAIFNFDAIHDHIEAIAEQWGIRVHSVSGLMTKLAQDNGQVFNKRLMQLEMGASAIRSYLIDKDNETIAATTQSVSGLPELVDRVGLFLSTQTRIPQVILLGESPGGLHSQGGTELENYYTFCHGQQDQVIRPALTRLLEVISVELGVDVPHFEFAPLWSPSASEMEATKKSEQEKFLILAQTMALLIESGAMSGDEMREASKANPLLAEFLDAKMMIKGE